MIEIITQIAIVFILIAIGYAANKLKVLDEGFNRKLSRLVILIACPCLVLYSVMGESVPQRGLILPLLLVSCCLACSADAPHGEEFTVL